MKRLRSFRNFTGTVGESDLFEFALTDHPPLVNVKRGNLRIKLEFWKRIGTSKFILNVIKRGYMLPFLGLPEPAVFRNNGSSLAHAKFVEDAIIELFESRCVLVVVVSPFTISFHSSHWQKEAHS